MEEQNQYFNYGTQYEDTTNGADYENANVLERWFNPGYAEMGEFNRENYLMDKGNAFNEYMFNKANEYNSPAAQMQRAENAGINRMLAAGGVMGGGNATATPMQSQGASVGANTNAQSPFGMANDIVNALKTGTDTATELGKMLGFGKTTKAELKIANETAKKIKGETKLNWQNERRLAHTFEDFCKEMKANRKAAEQNIKNLQELFNKYQEETKLLQKQQNLVGEQENTQKEETKQKQLENWELEFKKQFREMFGIQLNDSDASMLTQLILGGKGQQVIDAISEMAKSIFNGLDKTIEENINDNNPIEQAKDKLEKNGKAIHDKIKQDHNNVTRKLKYSNLHTHYCNEWDKMSNEAKNEWRKKGYDKWSYAKKMAESELNSASGTW